MTMGFDLAREALAPEGVLPLRVNETTPSVIICAEGSRISIQWREQRPDQPNHDEYGRAEAMAAFLVEAANRYSTAYDAIGSGVKAPVDAVLQAIRSWGDGPCDDLEDLERRVLSCLSTVAVEEADAKAGDYVLVPREATAAMLIAANDLLHDHPRETPLNVYRAMLAAAPSTPPAGAGPVGEAGFYAVSTRTGMHVGLWKNRLTAENVLREYEGGTLTPLYALPVEETGEVERAGKHIVRLAEEKHAERERAETAEAALRETRGRLEKDLSTMEREARWDMGHAKRKGDHSEAMCKSHVIAALGELRLRAALTGDAQEAGRATEAPVWGRWFPHDEAPGGSYACLYRNGELPVSLAWMPAQGRPTMPDTVVMPFRMPGDAQEAGR